MLTLPPAPDPTRPSPAPAPEAGSLIVLAGGEGAAAALDLFFAALDPDLSAAVLLLGPMAGMDDLLRARTHAAPLALCQVRDGDALRAGHVHLCPADHGVTIVDRRLHLYPRMPGSDDAPITVFFDSLAQSGMDRVVAILLSGNGSDGCDALRALTDAGGWVLVQDPQGAECPDLPRAALATGCAQDSGAPDDLARLTSAILRDQRDPVSAALGPAALGPGADPTLDDVLSKVSTIIAIDLSHYKPHTLIRRLERRVQATGRASISEYLDLLMQSMDESAALRREMMIPVTAFFRDADAFDDLRRIVLAPAFAALAGVANPVFRAWVVGCATGQEAYSLAILAQEEARLRDLEVEIKIFATDIEPSYLHTASQGRYPARAIDGLAEDLRARYFDPVDATTVQVSPRLRRSVVFSHHDALSAPPFLNLDLVSCRNMLIYLRAPSQDRVLKRLMFGLRTGAALFLGSAETPGSLTGLLDPVAPRSRIYRLKERLRHLSTQDVLGAMEPRDTHVLRAGGLRVPDYLPIALSPVAATAMDAFVPPTVVVTANGEIRDMIGDMTGFAQIRAGDAPRDLARLLPARTNALVARMLASVAADLTGPQSVVITPADDPEFGHTAPVRVTVRPVRAGTGSAALGNTGQMLVSFQDLSHPPAAQVQDDLTDDGTHRTAALEAELRRLRAALQITLEDLGRTCEDLQASTEAQQSTQEELHVVGAELRLVNAEFQHKILQLHDAYADLDRLSRVARMPMLFLDRHLCLTRYSAAATDLFHLNEQDLGRRLGDIAHDLDLNDLAGLVAQVCDSPDSVHRDVTSRDGRMWHMTIQPCPTPSTGPAAPDGARIVVSLIDVTSLRNLRHLRDVMDRFPHPLAVLDRAGRVTLLNAAMTQQVRSGPHGLGLGMAYLDHLRNLAGDGADTAACLAGLRDVLAGTRKSFARVVQIAGAQAPAPALLVHASALHDGGCVVTQHEPFTSDPLEQEKGAT